MKAYVLRPVVPSPEATSTGGRLAGPGGAGCQTATASAGLSKVHIPPPVPERGGGDSEVILYRGASLLKLPGEAVKGGEAPEGKRARVVEFSDASRRRLMQLLAMVRREAVPLFVTLTYPDAFPTDFAVYKAHLEAFGKRLRRRWPGASVVWRLEFQPRKSGESRGKVAPHFHLFVYGVPWEFAPQVERGTAYRFEPQAGVTASGGVVWETVVNGTQGARHRELRACFAEAGEGADKFMCWCSRNWFDVVGSGDVRHFRAGTRVERIRSPGGVMAYAAKRYVCKPEDRPQMAGTPGRFWGVMGRRSLPVGHREVVKLTAREVVELRRVVRRYRRANTKPERRKWCKRGAAVLFCNVEVWIAKLDFLKRGGSVGESQAVIQTTATSSGGQPA